MKRHIILYLFLMAAAGASAQSDRYNTIRRGAVRFVPGSAVLHTNPSTGMSYQSVGSPFISTPVEEAQAYRRNERETKAATDSSEQTANTEGKPKGEFHATVGLSVMAGFGKGVPNGAGVAQTVNASYSTSLGNKGWLTAGGYLNHLNWDGINVTDGGLYAELGYQFNEHWSAYLYGQKSLVNSGAGSYSRYAYPFFNGLYGYGDYPGCNHFGDKLGAAVRWTPNPNFSLQISVEKDWYPKPDFGYNRRFDYQR